jgi:hypothetical protein
MGSVVKRSVLLLVLPVLLAGCGAEAPEPERHEPRQAGQALSPLETAARVAAVRGSALRGDQEGVRRQVDAFTDDLRRSMKLADPARRVDREGARSVIREVHGIRSAAWIDHENLLVIVSSNEARSYRTIDEICLRLEPLGDTLGVVVNLQSGAAQSGDELEILSRNCQLAPGDRAFLQKHRQVDVVPPQVRAEHKRNNARPPADPERLRREQEEAMRILEASTPEM